MEYAINKLAKLAGVSTRTLRWYDERGLLKPLRIEANGYRIYGKNEIDRLQQILFYRELGLPLADIGLILAAEDFDALRALETHHAALCRKKEQLECLIANAAQSIRAMKGELTMTDHEKFEGFKQKLIEENEERYGQEIRTQHGDETIDRSNAKMKGMTQEQYAEAEWLSQTLNETLKTAFEQGDPGSELAQKACAIHRKWLSCYWDSYSKEAHLGVTQMYVDDPRFTAYYDEIAPGAAVFLRDAVQIYCS